MINKSRVSNETITGVLTILGVLESYVDCFCLSNTYRLLNIFLSRFTNARMFPYASFINEYEQKNENQLI